MEGHEERVGAARCKACWLLRGQTWDGKNARCSMHAAVCTLLYKQLYNRLYMRRQSMGGGGGEQCVGAAGHDECWVPCAQERDGTDETTAVVCMQQYKQYMLMDVPMRRAMWVEP